MEKLIRYLLASGMLLLLAACEPTVFNVPASTWDCMTPIEKQQVIERYNQEQINNPNKCCLRQDPQKKCSCQ